jgi:hypothetical protein
MLFWTTTSLSSEPPESDLDLLSVFATLFSLEIQSGFPRPVGHGFNNSVVQKTTAVEYDLLNAFFLGFGSNNLSNFAPLLNPAVKVAILEIFALRRQAEQRVPCHVINQLHFNMAQRTVYNHPRPFRRTRNNLAQTMPTPLPPFAILYQMSLIFHIILLLPCPVSNE